MNVSIFPTKTLLRVDGVFGEEAVRANDVFNRCWCSRRRVWLGMRIYIEQASEELTVPSYDTSRAGDDVTWRNVTWRRIYLRTHNNVPAIVNGTFSALLVVAYNLDLHFLQFVITNSSIPLRHSHTWLL